ncbi:MAG: thiamine pyrophosphate-dependent dehydrogenase E1 component subunit alpha [Rhodospirillales bacterium]|nr:thiamine pyrophosphate-dependent dehydrogenase E1 component subunit alpha [Rhodospirillales bacterium]
MLAKLYRSIYRIRRVEEEIERIYPTDKIKSPVHLSLGQESVAVGVCAALHKDDIVFATYRGHAAYLAKGGDLNRMIAELYGKATGCARGKAGSMHLIDRAAGFMGTSAIVATTIPQAVGYAFAMRYRKQDTVTVVFFGDGAVEEGAFHESLNFAALKQLPIIFVCENNLYAIHAPLRDRLAGAGLCARAQSYGIPAKRIEDGDTLALHSEVSLAAAEIRAGRSGPHFIEAMTYRYVRHVGPGDDLFLKYRSQEELDAWKAKDEVKRLAAMLGAPEAQRIRDEAEKEIAAAFDFAEKSPFPSPRELEENLFHA